jgi:transposase InsO family protein
MKACGTLHTEVRCNSREHSVAIIITERGDDLILGIDFCRQFNLVTLASVCIQRQVIFEENAVHITNESDVDYNRMLQKWKKYLPLGRRTGDPLGDLKEIFPETFDGSVGLFDGEAELKVSADAKPVQLPPRAIPHSVLPKLKAELDKMEKEGIIRPCPETTDWVHNVVIVSKKNGDIRLCLDPKNLNKYLIRTIHHTASWEDASASFAKGEFFSTLDAKSGYWSQKLSAESQLLTAFNTPFKKYCFVRLPFGLSVSSEIFCEQMDKALEGIPGTFPCADDVKVQGSTEEKHDVHLLETVERAQTAGIKFNPKKCMIKRREISYFGRIISPEGIKPCPDKVKAICEMQPPTDKQELQSFLGSVNFMASFIPHLTQRTHIMRGLLKKDVHFVWTSDMQREFDTIKRAIGEATGLLHFDTDKSVTIETDASMKGIGAVLLQDGQPVKFVSKSLTKAEAEYSNIERELLAVLFACEKLHIYVYGRKVKIHTDHKPLEAIFQKPISLAPARLQRMLLRLRMYDLDVKYVGAKSVLLADTLSRLIQPESHPAIPGLNVTIAEILTIRPTRLEQLRAETKSDPTLSKIQKLVENGWPESMQDLSSDLHAYWCFRDELVILDGLLMKGNRVIVPSTMRADTLTRLHDGHQGITATLQRARRTVYWPNLQADISATLQSCEACQIHGKKKPRIPDRQVSASRSTEILGVDLMHFKGKNILVSIDYYSGYIFVDFLTSETSDAVIRALNNHCRKFGLVERIISDNGPCFKSDKFREFCTELEINHTTSSPHFHESNGRAERAIQTVKQMLKKSTTDIQLTMAIIAYHDTPISNDLPSPAELFFDRRINSRLGVATQPKTLSDDQKVKLSERRSAHLKPPTSRMNYAPDDPVWFTEDGTPDWKPGFVESRDTRPDSYWLVNEDNSRRLRRNIHDMKPRVTSSKLLTKPRPRFTPTSSMELTNHPPPVEFVPIEPPEPEYKPDIASKQPVPAIQSPRKQETPCKNIPHTPVTPNIRRSGREVKPNKKPDFVYN